MAYANASVFWCILMCLLLKVSQATRVQLAPALYVFGDSLVDAGNNNPFNTYAKSNYPPYGIDFPTGSNGRPTNGFNMADIFATWLGLNIPPAYNLINGSSPNIYQGLNYASSAAGIIPKTGQNMFGHIMCLGEQIALFEKTIKTILKLRFPKPVIFRRHVSKSIFLVVMGANDISLNFLATKNSSDPRAYTNDVNFLIEKYCFLLKYLYKLGARKFVVYDIEALGCLPSNIAKFKPVKSKCVEFINTIVQMFNAKLSLKLGQLKNELIGSTFVLGKYYDFTINLVTNPSLYGLKDATNPCCVISEYGVCEPMKPPCPDRNKHAFFDSFHPTEAAYKAFAAQCFAGKGCVPMNMRQLALL